MGQYCEAPPPDCWLLLANAALQMTGTDDEIVPVHASTKLAAHIPGAHSGLLCVPPCACTCK